MLVCIRNPAVTTDVSSLYIEPWTPLLHWCSSDRTTYAFWALYCMAKSAGENSLSFTRTVIMSVRHHTLLRIWVEPWKYSVTSWAALISEALRYGSHSFCTAITPTPYLPLPRKRSPDNCHYCLVIAAIWLLHTLTALLAWKDTENKLKTCLNL